MEEGVEVEGLVTYCLFLASLSRLSLALSLSRSLSPPARPVEEGEAGVEREVDVPGEGMRRNLPPEGQESRPLERAGRRSHAPLSSQYGTHKTVEARFWPWLSGKSPQTL